MRSKVSTALRKICEMSRANGSYDIMFAQAEEKRIAVIDGVSGNHHVREDFREELRTTDSRALYRQLKKIYKDVNHDLHAQVVKDVRNFIKNLDASKRTNQGEL